MIISIFLVQCLHSRNLHSQTFTPVTKIILPLVAFLFADDKDLHATNSGLESIGEVVMKAQRLIDAWHSIFCFTKGNPNLSKCYWTMQDHQGKQGNCKIINNKNQSLHINLDRRRQEANYIVATQMRFLLGVPINLAHQHDQISKIFDEKIAGHIADLTASNLAPNNILFKH